MFNNFVTTNNETEILAFCKNNDFLSSNIDQTKSYHQETCLPKT